MSRWSSAGWRRPLDPGRPQDTRGLRVKVALVEPTPLQSGQRVEVVIEGK